jgi:hypothetical protein
MDGRYLEPRKVMWAVAEVIWQDAAGTSFRAPATLEDTSLSGACIRVQRPFTVGSRVIIKWHREQFSAIARNCRNDGRGFLLGVLRDPDSGSSEKEPAKLVASNTSRSEPREARPKPDSAPIVKESESVLREPPRLASSNRERNADPTKHGAAFPNHQRPSRELHRPTESPPLHSQLRQRSSATSLRSERKGMQPKTLFPQFWRRQQDKDAPATITEAPVNKPTTHTTESASVPRGDLLAYEDIYRAAGILSPGSGYGIHKVVEMLNSERIRDLSKDIKRASVLMALDAAGISVDDMLTDATRRQSALNSYEGAQKKQLEDFETRKAQENARIEEEMERIRAHYAQRVQNNLDQVTKEKDALRNWQNAMQSESQRIAEVIELCGKQPAPARPNTLAAAAGAQGTGDKSPMV